MEMTKICIRHGPAIPLVMIKLDVKKQKHHISTIWKKKSAEASNYFQCKPAEGCSGTIEPKRLADTLQSCVQG